MKQAPEHFTQQQVLLYNSCMTAVLFGPAAARVTERLYLEAVKGMEPQDVAEVLSQLLYSQYVETLLYARRCPPTVS